ncbi:PREDICTED: coiled-coil domain-containing protein 18 [Eufriesea mexicana]|uniref:coiled-coil domain-containing protein 18 n=1 Tax=Eufriesea mexicana TaxID=516756 RepID=UPI00083C4FF2|nr:PREDICTED: coiled-coil domain-containing protein 18 [Eufriesea mexicana]
MEYINKLLHRAAAIPARTSLSPSPSPTPPSGTDNSASKSAEHEVKVRFAREFADVGSITYSAAESLSSASSFQSLNSTLSTKSSSGICSDFIPQSPNQVLNDSYVDPNISGLEDLIAGCAGIHLNSDDEQSYNTLQNSQDFSQDQTFASATDDLTNLTKSLVSDVSLTDCQSTVENFESNSTTRDSTCSPINCTQNNSQERPILGSICIREPSPVANRRHSFIKLEETIEKRSISPKRNNDLNNSDHQTNNSFVNKVDEVSLPQSRSTEFNLNTTVCLSPSKEITDVSKEVQSSESENSSREIHSLSLNFIPCTVANSVCNSTSASTENAEELSLPSIPTFSSLLNSTDSSKLNESNNNTQENEGIVKNSPRSSSPVNDSNAAVISSPDIVEKSPAREVQDKSNSITESVPPNFPDNVSSDRQIPLDDTFSVRPQTPEIQENSAIINVCQEVESCDIIVSNIEQSLPKEESFELNDTTPKKEEIETRKPDESLGEKDVVVLEKTDTVGSIKEEEDEKEGDQFSEDKLDTTITIEDVFLTSEAIPEVEHYTEFKPQRQSTTLATLNIEQPNFEELQSAAEQVANDIFKYSLDFSEENDNFTSATSEIFQDPTSFDFLINHGNSKTVNRLRTESLYVKFDPLVADTSMLPQGNTQSINEEQNGKSENVPVNIDTPKHNPAIAAIDRLLFYSPISTNMTQKTNELQEKMASKEQPAEESKSDTPLITDINMSKELELVRATVLQLEEELEKQKKEYESELEKQKNAFQEKINKLQAQIAQEVKSKSQMTVVVEEYEKSISRLLTERERDRTNFEQEKAKLQEELQVTNVHLSNTEAAFNDVHQKYERLKGVMSAYKSNETVLKESIQENMETIKGLETRYDQLKNHAMAELEKANFELDAIRKQHEDETVKLHAMVRKAELKSNSLAELVEQKTKENKELTQILDEVIARVGHQNAE